jgi:hypothetical protein
VAQRRDRLNQDISTAENNQAGAPVATSEDPQADQWSKLLAWITISQAARTSRLSRGNLVPGPGAEGLSISVDYPTKLSDMRRHDESIHYAIEL